MEINTDKLNGWERFCLDNASHFTVARGRGKTRTVVLAATLDEAFAICASHGDGRSMIYAVTASNSSGHIGNA